MNLDVKRLAKVALRFSQIGSIPALKSENISDILTGVAKYFRKRLPQVKKKISITEDYQFSPVVNINKELFEWVIENLLKNAIDAIDDDEGNINIQILEEDRNSISIEISDTGKGINSRDKTEIFKPGYSTKRRGWGLGLSLAKRIVEDYHGGKLYVSETRIGKGSTFKVLLNSSS